jgi:gliding motility-associated protein GldC
MKNSEIKFNITLTKSGYRKPLTGTTDSGIEGVKDCRATMIAVWDTREKTTMRIDLWTKDMLVDDMKRFFYENSSRWPILINELRRKTNWRKT